MKAVILDMYGVILKDTGDNFYPFVNRTFPDLTPAEIYPIWDKADVGEISSLEVFRCLGYQGDEVQLASIEREYLDTVEINEGFYKFAMEIKKHCKLALLSNDSSEWSRFLRDKYELNQYFDVISVSGDLKMKKPDERIFKLTAEKLGCSAADCIYIDDRRYNLAAAQTVGMEAILFNSRNVDYEGECVSNFAELEDVVLRKFTGGM